MKQRLTVLVAVSTLWLISVVSCSRTAEPHDRQVAITIDDLPAGPANLMSASTLTDMTEKLLATLRDQKVPVVGFVNEQKLYKPGEIDERIHTLRMWLEYGFELGNHTFSHSSLTQLGLPAWENDIVQGESVTRLLLAEHQMKLRYFRHPFLDTGGDLQTRRQAEAFLRNRGYRIAPVTLDARDWMFAAVYRDAVTRGDTSLQQKLACSYLDYSDRVFARSEQFSKQIVGYEPKQILLLHANQLEADHIGELLQLLRDRGYRFITLEEALNDQAYSLADTYAAENGAVWLDHWAITQGKPAGDPPAFPRWVLDRWRALPQAKP